MKRRDLVGEILPIIRQELPGIRRDLHQKIAHRISRTIAEKVAGLQDDNRQLAAELAAARKTKRPKVDLSGVIQALQRIQEQAHGQIQ